MAFRMAAERMLGKYKPLRGRNAGDGPASVRDSSKGWWRLPMVPPRDWLTIDPSSKVSLNTQHYQNATGYYVTLSRKNLS